MKVYGPYTRKDGRQHVILKHIDGKKQTVSYPKYIMEQHLGRKLSSDETVHHKDGDFTNNDPSNMEVKLRVEHNIHDAIRAKKVKTVCIECGKELIKKGSDIRHNSKRGCAGPFCRSCAGKYGKDIQMGLIKKLPPQPTIEAEYYTIRDCDGTGRHISLKS